MSTKTLLQALAALGLSLAEVCGGELRLPNASFEDGLAGYWANAPEFVRVDATRAAQGGRSLALSARAGGEPTAIFFGIPNFAPNTRYVLTFKALAEAGSAVHVQAQLMLSADKPTGFWNPAKVPDNVLGDWAAPVEWRVCELAIDPLPELFMGQPVKRAGIFLRVAAPAGQTLWLDDLALTDLGPVLAAPAGAKAAAAAPPPPATPPAPLRLILPSPVQVFTEPTPVRLEAAAPPADATLDLAIRDERGQVLDTAAGPAAVPLTLTLAAPGYYDLHARLLGGRGQELAAATTSLVIVTPLPDDYYRTPEPAFGVWGIDAGLLRLGGAKWTRQPYWNQFEEPKGPLPAEPPSAEKLAARDPIKVIRQLNVLSPFKPMTALPREQWSETAAYLVRTVTRHRGLVDVWETQNEPMVGENFKGTPQDVVDLMRLNAEAVRQADPGRPVAGVCINPMTPRQYAQYLQYFKEFELGRLCEGVALHPYTAMSTSPDEANLVGVLNRLAEDLRAIAGREVPLYITEIGYSTKPAGEVSEEQQAAYLARTALLVRQVPSLRATVWHIGYFAAGKLNREGCYSLMRYAEGQPREFRQPKPAYAAWATMSRQTYDAKYLRSLDLAPNVVALLFERRGRPLLVAYTRDDRPEPFRLLLGTERVRLTDMCGRSRELNLPDGILSLTLDGDPIYIDGAAPVVFDPAALAVQCTPATLAALPGGRATFALSHAGLAGVAGARVSVEAPPGWQAGATLRDGTVAIDFAVAAAAQPGRQTLFVKVEQGTVIRYAWPVPVTVLAPVALAELTPSLLAEGQPGLRLRAVASPGLPPALLRVVDAEGKTLALQPLPAAGGACAVPLYDADPGRNLPLTAELSLPDGYRWRQALGGNAPFAVPRRQIAVDGRLEEWAQAAWMPIPPRPGKADAAHGRLAFAWNEEALLLAVDVADATPSPGTAAGSMFNADSIQLGVSVATAQQLRPCNVGIMETAYAELGFTATAAGPASWVWASMNRTTLALDGPCREAQVAIVAPAADRCVYELAVPWATLGIVKPSPGMPLRLSLTLNDRGPEGRQYLEWYGGIAQGKDPNAYGLGLLAP